MVSIGKLWGDARFGVLPSPSKLVYLYLISQPSITALGVVQVLLTRVALDIGLRPGEVLDAYHDLKDRDFFNWIREAPTTGEGDYDVFIIKEHFNSLPKSAVQMKRARQEGKTSPYREELLKIYTTEDFEQKTKFKPPTAEQVSEHAMSLGYLVDGSKFVSYYADNDWYNKKGKKVRSWKGTCERVWCREENKLEFPDNAPKGAERFYITTDEGKIIVPEGWRNGQPTHGNFLYAEQLKEEYAKKS